MNRMHPLPLEGRACIAHYDSRLDVLVVYVVSQSTSGSLADRLVAGVGHQPAAIAKRRRARHRRFVRAKNLRLKARLCALLGRR